MKTVRQVPVSDRLWVSLGALAESLGTDREALLQQALHAFLRFHGALPAEPPGETTAVAGPALAGAGPTNGAMAPLSRTPAGQSNGVGVAHASGTLQAAGTPARAASARRVLDTARELERAISPAERARTSPVLTLQPGQGSPIAVDRDRFLIGRGRHCDLVIDSAKVSREHAVIRREGEAWWIEDLGSSNGTWFDRARIDRRRIRDGDEFLVCAERIRCRIA